MTTEVDEAKQQISAALDIALDAYKQAQKTLKKVGCSVVTTKRLEALEALVVAVEAAHKATTMTRDYADVIKRDKDDTYNGKRWLMRRDEGGDLWLALHNVKNA